MFVLADQVTEIGRQIEVQRILARVAFNDVDAVTVLVGQFFKQREIKTLGVFGNENIEVKFLAFL